MIEQVGFTVGNEMAIQSGDPAFVASIKKFVSDNAHDFITLPQKDGSYVKARKDAISFFIFRELSDIIGTDGRNLSLVKDTDNEQPSSNGDTPNSGQDNSIAGSNASSSE